MAQNQSQLHSRIAELSDRALTRWGRIVEWLSFEVILTRLRRANGGEVILVRSILISIVIFGPLCILTDINPSVAVYGAILAAIYAALYARFSQQWHYLANLYNCIKTAEVRTASQEPKPEIRNRLAQWKAGFIEDADTLHLSNKPMIASIIKAWSEDERVAHWFGVYTIGGNERLARILREAHATCEREATKWRRSAVA